MKPAYVASILLLAALSTSRPVNNDQVIINKETFASRTPIYSSDHDITSIFVPLNQLNNNDDIEEIDDIAYIFFALADIDENGERTDQGLYVINRGEVKKLLDNGRDATATAGDNSDVYFGAKDGLYIYNSKRNEAEKYGTIKDSIAQLVKEAEGDALYILTDDNKVYRVTDEGSVKTKIDAADGAKEIAIDFSNNLYFFKKDLHPYVINNQTVRRIEGLPEKWDYGKLIRPVSVFEDTVSYAVDDQVYLINANGSSSLTEFVLEEKPTAYAMDASIVQFYGYDKKIYEYNILTSLFDELLAMLREHSSYLKDDNVVSATSQ